MISEACGQKVWVYLRDKHETQFDPYAYFDHKAIERRKAEGISLTDSSDFPLNENYVAALRGLCDSISGQSRWLNAVACVATDEQQRMISRLPFVKSVEPMLYHFEATSYATTEVDELDETSLAVLRAQTERMQHGMLRQHNATGKGVRIAILDAGFNGVLGDKAFDNLLTNDRIRATYDFVKDKKFVFTNHTHGANVLSCIAGQVNGEYLGCANEAEFLLARTEQHLWEGKSEEENWVEALEWADKWGADIINSSLGYTTQFYFTKDMDGKKSVISRAASMAVRKGILVVNSAGNEGYKDWEVIAAPADADSILTIGGIDPWTGYHSDFSSYGPTADMRMKPNLCAFGYAITADNNKLAQNTGTSFASPLVAGFAACIKQLHPEWTVMQLYDELQHSGDLYPYFDYAHGYGVPQASYFFPDSIPPDSTTIADSITVEYQKELDRFRVFVTDKGGATFSDVKEKWETEKNYSQALPFVYVHIQSPEGVLLHYEVMEPGERTAAIISSNYDNNCVVRIRWRNAFLLQTIGELKLKTND